MRTLHLCGAGNSEGVRLALHVNAVTPRWSRIVLLDDDPARHGAVVLGVRVIGPFDVLADADPERDGTVNLVARTTAGRRRAGARIASFGIPRTGMTHPEVDTLGATVAEDALVYPHAILGPESEVGPGAVVFMGAVVGHEAHVGRGCVIAANAVLNARVRLGEEAYVGSNASILPEIVVGAQATVGAGSTVVDDVAEATTVMGVPASAIQAGPPSFVTGRRPDATTLELALRRAWAEVLGRPTMAASGKVFELGATSLTALQVAERVRVELGVDIRVTDLFRFATIQELAEYLGGAESSPPPAARPSPRKAHVPSADPGPHRTIATAGSSAGDDLEAAVTEVFREVLGAPGLGPNSHFFEAGGDTTCAYEACRTLLRVTGRTLCFVEIARHPTARDLAKHLGTTTDGPPRCPAHGMVHRLIHRSETHRA